MTAEPALAERRVAVITGAGGAIGRAAAARLSHDGYAIVAVDRDTALLDTLVNELGAGGVTPIVADVSDEASSAGYVSRALSATGRIDVFFNNAGIAGPTVGIADMPMTDFDRLMAVNVRGIFLGLKFVIPVMLAQRSGSIVNSASSAGSRGAAGLAAYVASKHAVIGLTRSAAAECAPMNVRVNCIAPGPVSGALIESICEGGGPGTADRLVSRIPAGRLAQPSDVAAMVSFLASDNAAYVNGAVLPIDGGRTSV